MFEQEALFLFPQSVRGVLQAVPDHQRAARGHSGPLPGTAAVSYLHGALRLPS